MIRKRAGIIAILLLGIVGFVHTRDRDYDDDDDDRR